MTPPQIPSQALQRGVIKGSLRTPQRGSEIPVPLHALNPYCRTLESEFSAEALNLLQSLCRGPQMGPSLMLLSLREDPPGIENDLGVTEVLTHEVLMHEVLMHEGLMHEGLMHEVLMHEGLMHAAVMGQSLSLQGPLGLDHGNFVHVITKCDQANDETGSHRG